MRKIVFAVVLSILLAFPTVNSQAPLTAEPKDVGTYWHSNDYYSIELTGAGRAFVVQTIQLESLTEKQVKSIQLEIPYRNVQIYRVMSAQYWVYDVYGGKSYGPFVLNYTTQLLSDSTILNIDLALPLNSTRNTETIYLVFSTERIAKETIQGFEFNFESVKDPNALIRYSSANVVVPQNMYLKGKPEFDIQYRPTELASQIQAGVSAEKIASILPPYYGGQYSANNLSPGESFTIKGLYGKDVVLLYLQEILSVAMFVVLIAIALVLGLGRRIKRMFDLRGAEERLKRKPTDFSFGRVFLVSLFSAFLFIGTSVLLTFVGNILNSGPYYYGTSSFQLLIVVLSFIAPIVALFGLPYLLFTKFNKTEGIVAGILSMVFAVIILALISYYFSSPTSPPIIYLNQLFTRAQTAIVDVTEVGSVAK